MVSTKSNSRGFTLIAALLMLTLMSAAAIGLFMMVNSEVVSGGNDLQNAIAYREAEGGIEHMTSDLADLFTSIQNPQPADIEGLSSNNPDPHTYVDYTFTPDLDSKGKPVTNWTLVPSGTFQGLYAQSLDVNLLATAQTPLNQQASIMRTVQLDLIPVFQFGVFSEPDLSIINNPTFDFGGRVHTNGDLYLDAGSGATVTFHNKLEAYGNVIREVWPNEVAANGSAGTIDIPTTSGGCDGAKTGCKAMTSTWGSIVGLPPIPGSSSPTSQQNTSPKWKVTSETTYTGMITDGDWGNTTWGSGALNLNLPFITGSNITTGNQAALQHQILSQPLAGEDASSSLGQSRLYNQAEIRILLADDPSEFQSNPGNTDQETVELANTGIYQYGVPTSVPSTMPKLTAPHSYNMYFATASTGIPDPTTCGASSCDNLKPNWLPADWAYQPANPLNTSLLTIVPNSGSVGVTSVNPPLLQIGTQSVKLLTPTTLAQNITSVSPPPCSTSTGTCTYPYYTLPDFPPAYYAKNAPNPEANSTWNLLDGYIRIEALEGGAWVGVTQEWLQLGFARAQTPPTTAGTNPVNPNAIIILQEAADRSGNGGTPDYLGVSPSCIKKSAGVYTCSATGRPPEIAYDQITNCTPAVNCAYYGDGFNATAPPTGNYVKGTPSVTMYNWYPINFYDKREGESWDVANTKATTCAANGVMNTVELDVGNLNQWLLGNIGATGKSVSNVDTSGYIVYFSDRRGMLKSAGIKNGEYGFEDTVNLSASGVPDGKFEPTPPNKVFSPEDVDEDGALETYGGQNIGLGFGVDPAKTTNTVNADINAGGTPNPYLRFSCSASGRQNWVSGARHVLRLVDGKLGQVPLPGFTVGAENPVYVLGDYNSTTSPSEDTTFADFSGGTSADEANKSNAAIIADAVTLLSNNWMDWGQDASGNPIGSFSSYQSSVWTNTGGTGAATAPTQGKTATTTSYRVSIASGKSVNFLNPKGNPTSGGGASFGTDGGVGNFLRLLEDWCSNKTSCNTQQTLYYSGSMVNLYYAEYATGTFKCCDDVYNPPVRKFMFDDDLSSPSGLPPGTPTFRDVDNLSYRQIFTQRTNADQ